MTSHEDQGTNQGPYAGSHELQGQHKLHQTEGKSVAESTNPLYLTLKDASKLLQLIEVQSSNPKMKEVITDMRTRIHDVLTTTVFVDTPSDTLQRTGQERIKQSTTPDDSVLSQAVEAAERARSTPDTVGHPSEAYIGRDDTHAIRWIPEAPGHPGLYACKADNSTQNCTAHYSDALQFVSKQKCKEWCEQHPVPKFVPVEHMFDGLDLRG